MKTIKTWTVHFFYLFEDFHLYSCYNNINYCAWYVYKHLFGSSVATSQLAFKKLQ